MYFICIKITIVVILIILIMLIMIIMVGAHGVTQLAGTAGLVLARTLEPRSHQGH